MRQKYILFLTVATFVLFCFGGLFFLPETKSLIRLQPVVNRQPQHGQQHQPPSGLDSAHILSSGLGVIPAPDIQPQPKQSRISDMKRLAEKIRQEMDRMNVSQVQAVAPKPFDLPVNEMSSISSGLDAETSSRRETVKQMLLHAWNNYVRYAWGENELRPISRKGHSPGIFGSTKLGASIVDAMDTLWIMGLRDEFARGRDWIRDNLSLDEVNADLSVFEFNIRFIGGLLSAYALSRDRMFLDRADQFAQKLLPAFDTPTGLPFGLINPSTGSAKNYVWASSSSSILSELGSMHLEFVYLSHLTGKSVYRDKVIAVRDYLDRMQKPNGLYPNYINPRTGLWGQHHMSMGALGDSFYEYLLKQFIQSGGTEPTGLRMYEEAMDGVTTHLLQTSAQNHLMYFADMKYDRLEHKMDHLACFSGGLLGLGAQLLPEKKDRHMEIAAGITNTCHESYIRTTTKIGPESFRFSEQLEAKASRPNEKYYILRPETFESYFVMWRLTKDQKYRDWAWDAVQALEKHCRVDSGYSGLKNVYDENGVKDDVQQSFVFAETFKYLYLIFSEDDLMPLDQWVFNTEAHPLPIRGKNTAY